MNGYKLKSHTFNLLLRGSSLNLNYHYSNKWIQNNLYQVWLSDVPVSEVFTIARLSGEGWKHFQTINDLFEKGEVKGQTVKPTDAVKKGKPMLRQWQLKPLCRLSSQDQTFLLEKVSLKVSLLLVLILGCIF